MRSCPVFAADLNGLSARQRPRRDPTLSWEPQGPGGPGSEPSMPKLRVSDSEESKPKRVLHKTSSAEERDTQTEDEMSSAERGPLDETSMQDPGTAAAMRDAKAAQFDPKRQPARGGVRVPNPTPHRVSTPMGFSMQRERERDTVYTGAVVGALCPRCSGECRERGPAGSRHCALRLLTLLILYLGNKLQDKGSHASHADNPARVLYWFTFILHVVVS